MSDLGQFRTPAWCFALALLSCASPAFSQGAAGETVRSEVRTGTLHSSVGAYGFLTRSREAARIFATCKVDDECQVEADVRGDQIVGVRSVKLVRKGN
jgi:hypothetical protein